MSVASDHASGAASPATPEIVIDDVDTPVVGSHVVGTRVGLVPCDRNKGVPRPAADGDFPKVKANVRQKPIEPLVPLSRFRQRRSRSAERMLTEKRVLEPAGEHPQHRLGVTAVDGIEQSPDAAADNGVVHAK